MAEPMTPSNEPPPPVTVLLTYDLATGNFNMQGPLDNRVLIYGILALAHEALQRKAIGDKGLNKGSGLVLPRPFR